jgi:hypothetical protein
LLSAPGIEFIGEISEAEKQQFLSGALALLFPVDWPEPFGLVVIEALACGTPVIARPCGSVPEVLRHGVTGFIGSSVDELAAAVHKLGEISRQKCREEFETNFTAEVMAANYERVYWQLTAMDWTRTRRAAARSKRPVANASLARYAARQWHPAPEPDQLNTRSKETGPVRPTFSNAYRDDIGDSKKFDS